MSNQGPVTVNPAHWLDDDGLIPAEPPALRNKALRVAQAIEAGGPLARGQSRETLTPCTKRPDGVACPGLMVVIKQRDDAILGYADGGDAPDKQLALVPGAVEEADSYLVEVPETRTRFDRVVNLVEGFETPFGMELLATIHWVSTREQPSGSESVVERVYAWGERKRRFSPRQIQLGWEVLAAKGWLARA